LKIFFQVNKSAVTELRVRSLPGGAFSLEAPAITWSETMADISYPCYKVKKDTRGQWYWVYYAKNREEISKSSESYVAKADCLHGIKLNKASGSDPVFEA
jgi:uncharacterized protein YegP (UPF0339 family)